MFGIPIDLPATATKEERDAYFKGWNETHKEARKKAKAVNFGIPYGEGAEGLADQLKVPVAEAQKWLDDWAGKTFPVAAKWLQRTVDESRKAGGVSYSLGRFRALPGFASRKQSDQSAAERQAKNTPIQGTGGDCTSLSIVRIHDRFRKELGARWFDIARIVLEVHDQIVVEVLRERAEEIMAWVMEEMSRQMPFLPDTLALEVDADIKQKWGD
jgi:DNA polymerase-1